MCLPYVFFYFTPYSKMKRMDYFDNTTISNFIRFITWMVIEKTFGILKCKWNILLEKW
jgi:hypothetical protein